MFSVNQLLSLSIAIVVTCSSFAQTTYESPHAKDGKTIQFTFPDKYYKIVGSTDKIEIFTIKENVDIVEFSELMNTMPTLAIWHFKSDYMSLDSTLTTLEQDYAKNDEKRIQIEAPIMYEVNGRNIVFAGAKGEIGEKKMEARYFCATEFGDYLIAMTYSATQGIDDVMTYTDFKEIALSWKEIETNKQDRLSLPDFSSGDYDMDYEREMPKAGENTDDREAAPPMPPPPSRTPPKEEEKLEEEIIEN